VTYVEFREPWIREDGRMERDVEQNRLGRRTKRFGYV
jgi:hypothetical protein